MPVSSQSVAHDIARPLVETVRCAVVRVGCVLILVGLFPACATTTRRDTSAPPSSTSLPAVQETPSGDEDAPTAPASVSGQLEEINETIVDDESVAALLNAHRPEVDAASKRVVGQLSAPLTKSPQNGGETSLGNFASDALRVQMSTMLDRHIDVCFQNMGGLRRDLDAGPVTAGDIVEVMPFDNAVVVFEASGKQTRQILSHAATRGDPVSGARFRVVNGAATNIVVDGAPLVDDKTYVMCTNDYVFEGGGGYPFSDVKATTHTGILVREAFIAAFEEDLARGKKTAPVVDGRVAP